MTAEKCGGFTVYPPSAFYPVYWNQWQLYFNESKSTDTMEMLRNSIAIHVWNKLSKTERVKFGSTQPYGLIAQKHCPRVYEQSQPVF
ncbi:hypothetical protein PR048_002904 [Dryococelus australis]|uniref:Alpha 1,4-glycosyltransferase domain-containing protein n=1 Tax=Dryococelus australis TaxID=614101 RepID=A0ABQ9ILH0_9NEOP|nr:hypothetical protein PR048_002904 [Dryococelus australis]